MVDVSNNDTIPAAAVEKIISPYYLHPSDNTGQVLSPILLNGANYERWAKLMMNSLRTKRKIGFIDGTQKRPSAESVDSEKWDMVNSMVIGWIYSSIEPKLRPSISLVESAKVMWAALKRRFSVSDDTRIHQLHTEISSCKQDGDSVEEYYGKLKVLWDDLADFDKGFSCCCANPECDSMVKYAKTQERVHIHQFLMGLDTSRFGTTRSNLLSRGSDLNLDLIYSQIIQEERHLSVMRSAEERVPAVGFSATSGSRSSAPQAASIRTDRSSVICSHCGKSGHETGSCFQIIGFPDWWNDKSAKSGNQSGRGEQRGRGRGSSNNGRGRGGRSTGSRANAATFIEESTSIPALTPEQWSSLASFVANQKSASGSEKLSGKTEKLLLYNTNRKFDIIIDSGASHHMTGDIGLLTDLVDINPCPITLPNGKLTWANKHGRLCLGGQLVLNHVFYAPHMSITLISVAQLLNDIAGCVLFTKKYCLIQDRTLKTSIGAGKERDGVYHYTGAAAVQSYAGKLDKHDLWHRRLGHPSDRVLSVLSDLCGFSTRSSSFNKACDVCIRAKQTRTVFFESSNKAASIFSMIHCDLWGPYRAPSSCGARYFLTIVDDFSRAVWTILLLEKKEAPTALKNFFKFVERQFNTRIRVVRSDNGSEFLCLKQFFADSGVVHQRSCVATPQQNGRAERKHRHILNVARSLLFQAHLPLRFWGESILTATYLINHTPSKLCHNKSPLELLTGKSPSYDNIRVFGSLCYAKKVARDTDKFAPRGIKCIFLGYPLHTKGWFVFDLENKKKFISRDVVFHEEEFPFMDSGVLSKTSDSLRPSSHPAIFDDDEVGLPSDTVTGGVDSSVSPISTSSAPNSPVSSVLPPSPVSPASSSSFSDSLVSPVSIDSENINTPSPEPTPPPPEPEELGRGKRQKTRSVLLEPFITYTAQALIDSSCSSSSHAPSSSGMCSYPISDYVSYHRFSPAHQIFCANVMASDDPVTYNDAVRHKVWRNAVGSEYDALELNRTWDIVTLPPKKKAIGCKWVFRTKFKSDGTIERYKARLVALGNRQKEGYDYNETFAPVVKMNTVRILLEVSAAKDWEIHQMDVYNAFLHGDLEEEVYMKLPPGYTSAKPTQVCKLRKSLYGLKQAPRCWFAKLSQVLLGFGFVQNYLDYSLFTLTRGSSTVYVLVYVDDLIIGGNDSVLISNFKSYLNRCFKMKDLGAMKYFLGIEVSRGNEGIYLSQRKYAMDIIAECGLLGAQPVVSPLEQNHNLARDTSPFIKAPDRYRRLVGRLVYLAVTRPDLSYAVHILAQFMQQPRQRHWEAALRLVKYLKGSPGRGILLRSKNDLSLSAYCDSDYAACPLTRRSLTGYLVMLGGSVVSWKTKKQHTVSRSSAEAEYRSMALLYQELIWTVGLLDSLGIKQPGPIPFYCDNQAALHIARNPVFHERTKHIEVDCHFVREGIQTGVISPRHIRTHEQLSDLLTKALGRQQMDYLLRKMGIRDLHAPS